MATLVHRLDAFYPRLVHPCVLQVAQKSSAINVDVQTAQMQPVHGLVELVESLNDRVAVGVGQSRRGQ